LEWKGVTQTEELTDNLQYTLKLRDTATKKDTKINKRAITTLPTIVLPLAIILPQKRMKISNCCM